MSPKKNQKQSETGGQIKALKSSKEVSESEKSKGADPVRFIQELFEFCKRHYAFLMFATTVAGAVGWFGRQYLIKPVVESVVSTLVEDHKSKLRALEADFGELRRGQVERERSLKELLEKEENASELIGRLESEVAIHQGISVLSQEELLRVYVGVLSDLMEANPGEMNAEEIEEHLRQCLDRVQLLDAIAVSSSTAVLREVRQLFNLRAIYASAVRKDRNDVIPKTVRISNAIKSLEATPVNFDIIPGSLRSKVRSFRNFMAGSLYMYKYKYDHNSLTGDFPLELLCDDADRGPSGIAAVKGKNAMGLLEASYADNPMLWRACINLGACCHYRFRAIADSGKPRTEEDIKKLWACLEDGERWARFARGGSPSSDRMAAAENNLADVLLTRAALRQDADGKVADLNRAMSVLDRVRGHSRSGAPLVTAAEARCALARIKQELSESYAKSDERSRMASEVYELLKEASVIPYKFPFSSVDDILRNYPSLQGVEILFDDPTWAVPDDPEWVLLDWKSRFDKATREMREQR